MEEYLDVIDRFIKVCDEDLYTEIGIKCDGLTRKAIEELAKAYRELENKYKFYENMEQKYFEISKELSALNSEYFKLKQKLEEKMPTFKREPCLCCECDYWQPYVDQYGINWGYCKKGKTAFPEMGKCMLFVEKK